MNLRKSRYTREDLKHIRESIENLKNDEYCVAIFEILSSAENSYTQNSNGVFLNLSVVDDATLDKISKFLEKINEEQPKEIETDVDLIPMASNTKSNRTYKLSNYEKNIIKQRNLKKVLNEDNEYEELKFSPKKKSPGTPAKNTKKNNQKSKSPIKITRKSSEVNSKASSKKVSARSAKSEL